MKKLRTLAALMAVLCCSIASAHDFEVDGIYYNIISTEDKTVEVTYRGSYSAYDDEYSGNVVIPSSVIYNGNTYSVTSIGSSAFDGCSGLTSITIPNSVTSIGWSAFRDCYGLTSITIPNSVTSIGSGAFWDCDGLTSITIPNSVTSIGSSAFSGCTGLTSITIPNSVTSIGNNAFDATSWYNNQEDGLLYINNILYEYKGTMPAGTSIKVKEGTTSIVSDAFYLCSGLTSITIPNSVTSIGRGAFAFCDGLTSITIPEGVTSIGNSAFEGCSSLTSITIPEGVTSIGDSAFEGCSGLKEITIPESVISIGDDAFKGCRSLTSINIPNSVTSIGWGAFQSCSGLTSINIPEGVTSIGSWAFSGCSGLTSITIPEGVTYIGESAFKGCRSLTSITIPEGVTYIGEGAFYWCSGLTSITILNSVTSIGDWAFDETPWYNNQEDGLIYINSILYKYKGTMPARTSITVKEGTKSIADGAFSGCTGLTSITIPNSVTSIKGSAFKGCRSLTSITIPNSVTSIGGNAFEGCDGLTSITIPEGVTSIGNSAFEGCSSLTSITIPNSVTSIGGGAFRGCSSLTSITIPNSVTSIGGGAFRGCDGLTSINIPNSVTSIGNMAFYNCTGLTSINIPNSVTSIGGGAFAFCDGLTSIQVDAENPVYDSRDNCNAIIYTEIGDLIEGCKNTVIPNSVTSIGWDAFEGRSGLTSITIPESVTYIYNYAFRDCSSLTSITIPESVTYIGEGAFSGCSSLESVYSQMNTPCAYPGDFGGSPVLYIPSGTRSLYFEQGWDDWASKFVELNYEQKFTLDNIEYEVLSAEELTCEVVGGSVSGDVVLPANVTSPVTSIEYSVTSIGDSAFYDCSGLTSVEIPSSVTRLGERAFAGCSSLESVTFEEGNSSPLKIYPYAFQGCTSLTRVSLPSNLTRYAWDESTTWGMFEGCNQLTYVKMPYLPMTYPSTLFGKGDQYTRCYFDIPEGRAGDFIHYGYYNISDLSKIGWMRSVFADELAGINEFAAGLADGAAKDELNETLNLAAAKVDTMTSYVGIIGQIDTIKTAVKNFAGKVSLAKNTEVTAFIKNPYFNYEAIGWDVFYTGEKIDSVVNAFVQNAKYVNGDVTINKFLERWAHKPHLEDCEMTQTLTGLPAGHYRIEIDVLAATQDSSNPDVEGVSLVMNNQKIAISTENNTPEHVTLELEVLPAKDVKLGLQVENSDVRWIALDNFRLFYVDGMPQSSEDSVYLHSMLEMPDTEVVKGGANVLVPVSMENEESITAFQFEVSLPDGVTMTGCELSARKAADHSVSFSKLPNGNYQVVCISLTSKPFSGTEGVLVNLQLSTDKEMAVGSYEMGICNIELSTTAAEVLTQEDLTATLTVLDVKMGDTNGDGKISITDAVAIVNYILGNPSANYVEEASDVNGDGRTSITDAVAIVNKILSGESEAKDRMARKADLLDPQ